MHQAHSSCATSSIAPASTRSFICIMCRMRAHTAVQKPPPQRPPLPPLAAPSGLQLPSWRTARCLQALLLPGLLGHGCSRPSGHCCLHAQRLLLPPERCQLLLLERAHRIHGCGHDSTLIFSSALIVQQCNPFGKQRP